jgi:hypothetical protein
MTTMRSRWWAAQVGARRPVMMALALCFAAGCGAPEASVATQAALVDGDRDNPNPALYEKNARPFGITMESWSEEWWRWVYSMPATANPNIDLTVDCARGQQGPMFFLPTYFGSGANARACTVPRHKAIGVSLVSLLNDYPCPDPTFQPAPGQTLFDFLLAGAVQGQAADVASVAATLDGKPLADLSSYHFVSDDLFYLTGDASLQSIDGCVTGTRQPAVAASYFIVFDELAPGPHVLVTSWTSPSGAVQTLTYNLTVAR